MIAADGLTRSFGGRPAVQDVTFEVQPGEIVGLLGPNGAGKSTTIRALLGIVRADAGSATCARPVGYAPETLQAEPALTVRGWLTFLARLKGSDTRSVDESMERAGVSDLASRPIARLSRGQRQRTVLAQALLGRPVAYVLDEPTTGLDPKQIVQARDLIASLREGAAVLLSTHLLAEAAAICDRVVILVRGRVVAVERPGQAPDLEDRFLRMVGEAETS